MGAHTLQRQTAPTIGLRSGAPARWWPRVALVGLLLFQGVSAVGGGAAMILDPSGATLGWSTELLAATSFATYAWPGWMLALGLGVPALLLARGVARRPSWDRAAPIESVTGYHWSWIGSIGLGICLMGWIVGQVTLVDVRSFLQPVMFLVGAAITVTTQSSSVRDWLALD